MLFSIIIPAYNAENTIENCINSVMIQTEKDYEIIAVDDGSKDGTLRKLQLLLGESSIISKKNGGVSRARNDALDIARGDYVIFLDADDCLPVNALEMYKREIVEEDFPEVIIGGFIKKYPKKTQKVKLDSLGRKKLLYDKKNREFNPYNPRLSGTVWGKCYKKSAIGANRFNENFSLCEDAEFNFRVFQGIRRFSYIDAFVYEYTYSLNSTIRRYDPKYIQGYVNVTEQMYFANIDSVAKDDFLSFACSVFNVICFNVICTVENTHSRKEKIKQIKHLGEYTVFQKIVKETNLKNIPLKHRAPIFLAQKEKYSFIYVMSWVNTFINKILY